MTNNESLKTVPAKTFKECVPQMIQHEMRTHPDMPHKQAVAVAYNKCREKFHKARDEFNSFDEALDFCRNTLKSLCKELSTNELNAISVNISRKLFPESSKARIIRQLEKIQLTNRESLEPLIFAIKKSLNHEELIEYAVLLKGEGLRNQEIASLCSIQRPYSVSWVKKYINPQFKMDTELEKIFSEAIKAVTFPPEIRKSVFRVVTLELRKEKREFDCFGTVEVRDSENELIEVDGVAEIMPTYMERGGILLYGHSNRHVGNILKWAKRKKEVDGQAIDGIWLRGKIFNHYQIDDEAWESVKLAKKYNLPVVSLGATPIQDRYDCTADSCHRVVEKEHLYEWSITQLIEGVRGANPEATIERTIEKDHDIAVLLKDLYLSSSQIGSSEYQELLSKGLNEEKASELILMDVLNKMSTPKEKIKASTTPDSEKDDSQGEVITKDDLTVMVKAIQEIHSMLKQLTEKQAPPEEEEEPPAPPQEEETPPEEEEEKETPPESETREDALTLSKNLQNVTKEQFLELAKAHNYQVVASTPVPTTANTRNDLAKRNPQSTKKGFPSQEEFVEAMQRGDGSLEKLREKYGL